MGNLVPSAISFVRDNQGLGVFIVLVLASSAVAGDWLAYDLTLSARSRFARIPFFGNDPKVIERGIKFFERWGLLAAFVGRFFGPASGGHTHYSGLVRDALAEISNCQLCVSCAVGHRRTSAGISGRPLADWLSAAYGSVDVSEVALMVLNGLAGWTPR